MLLMSTRFPLPQRGQRFEGIEKVAQALWRRWSVGPEQWHLLARVRTVPDGAAAFDIEPLFESHQCGNLAPGALLAQVVDLPENQREGHDGDETLHDHPPASGLLRRSEQRSEAGPRRHHPVTHARPILSRSEGRDSTRAARLPRPRTNS